MKALEERQRLILEADRIFNKEKQDEPTPEERAKRMKDLQYIGGENLFVVAYTSLHKAAYNGSADGIKFFLSAGNRGKKGGGKRIDPDDYDKNGICAIHYAAEKGHNHVIELLLKKKATLEVKSSMGCTAVMMAAKEGHVHTIEYLASLGSDLFETNNAGSSAAHFACQGDHIRALRAIVGCFTKMKVMAEERIEFLKQAAQEVGGEGEANIASMDASTKANSQANSDVKATVVPDTSEEQRLIDLVEMPVKSVVDIISRSGGKAIHMAAEFDSRECVAYLISLGVRIDCVDSIGETPLHKAARKNHFIVYDILVKAGANEHIRNLMRETPIQLLRDDTKYA